MWSLKGLRHRNTPTPMPTSHHHTVYAIRTKDLFDLPRESFEYDQTSGNKNKNVKMCKVCLATFNHEPKCTNTQLQLEGANSLYAK
jgi:hypothetical protein